MSHKKMAVAFGLILASSPLAAQAPDRDRDREPMAGAPEAGPGARYCMRVEAGTGRLVETIQCWTREQWAHQGVDVDKEWAKEGVAVREDGMERART